MPSIPPEKLRLRSCVCSFCVRHRARTTTDRNGRAEILVRSGHDLNRYRFGLKTADFLVCRNCGVYAAAVIDVDGGCYATINVNIFGAQAGFGGEASPVGYEGEDESQRVLRRKSRWTPAAITIAGP